MRIFGVGHLVRTSVKGCLSSQKRYWHLRQRRLEVKNEWPVHASWQTRVWIERQEGEIKSRERGLGRGQTHYPYRQLRFSSFLRVLLRCGPWVEDVPFIKGFYDDACVMLPQYRGNPLAYPPSCTRPKDNRIRRAGWGLWAGNEHPWNCCGPLLGPEQSAFRAELRALVAAVELFSGQLEVACDCRSAVKEANRILEEAGKVLSTQPHSDL